MADQHDVQDVLDEAQWEKSSVTKAAGKEIKKRSGRWRFMVLGLALLGAVGYLVINSVGARYYVTVDELLNDEDMVGKNVRVSGAVVGDPEILRDENNNVELHFVVANIPNDNDAIREQGGLAKVLYTAVNSDDATRLKVVAYDLEIPDQLRHEAQAIMSGHLEIVNGEPVFVAEEIQTKCPTKYEEDNPDRVAEQ